jgi:hypothetical protein
VDPATCTVTLWHASGVEVPRELLAALSGVKGGAGGVKVEPVGDPFRALAQLCRIRRRESQGEPTRARLVIVYPEMLTDAAELCAAADVYAPGVPRWQYGPASNPTLRPIVDTDVQTWETPSPSWEPPVVEVVPAAAARASRTQGGPQLRLAGEGPGVTLDNQSQMADVDPRLAAGFSGGQTAPPAARSGPLITDEELRMLLGESNEENR